MTLTDYSFHDVTLIEGPDHSYVVAHIGPEIVVYKKDGNYEPWCGQELEDFDTLVFANVVY